MKKKKPLIFDIKLGETDALKRISTLLTKGNYKAVIKESNAAIVKYPKVCYFYTMPAIAYMALGNNSKALSLLTAAKDKFPGDYEVFFQLASLCEDLEEYDKAEFYYRESYKVTPIKYNDCRAECRNELGKLYWKLRRKEEALEEWRLALNDDLKNNQAKRNLKIFTNVYGEPKSISQLMDDVYHFQNIQRNKFFKVKNLTEFRSLEEADKIIRLISDAWNKEISSDKEKLDFSSAKEKTKWFESIKVDFDTEPLSEEEKKMLFDKTRSKSNKNPLPKRKVKLSKAEKEMEDLNRKFPYLPEGGISQVTTAASFLASAGMGFPRFEEILENGTNDDEEMDLILWAYDIGKALLESLLSDNEEEAECFLDEALSVASDYLDDEELEYALNITMKALQEINANGWI